MSPALGGRLIQGPCRPAPRGHGARPVFDKEPVRIGIAFGEVVAGYTGTEERATYTCIGDTVNLAARLEAHTKAAGRDILVDGATQAALGDRVPVEAMG